MNEESDYISSGGRGGVGKFRTMAGNDEKYEKTHEMELEAQSMSGWRRP